MRVGTAFYYETSTMALLAKQENVNKVQQQLDTGRRIVTPSDDPIGATHALQSAQAVALSESYLSNMATATNKLSEENNVLGAVDSLLGQAKGFAASAGGNPTTQQRTDFANYLTNVRDSLIAYANEVDSEGNYIFSGSKGSTKPYTFASVADNTTVPATTTVTTTYNGDAKQQSITIAKGRNLPVSDPGSSVFGATPNDVFSTINQLIKDLNSTTSLTGAAYDAAINTASTKIDTAITTVRSVNSAVASRVQEVKLGKATETNFRLQSQNELARVESVDLQQAAVLLQANQTTLQASQQSFVKTSNLNLFNYL
jgi:flagellar hook-associated protein 3 FlgL